jgi:hypothetical protein
MTREKEGRRSESGSWRGWIACSMPKGLIGGCGRDRGYARHQQENALSAFPIEGRPGDRPFAGAVSASARSLHQTAGGADPGESGVGCAFLNALAELGSEDSEARGFAVAYKDRRRLWYPDLLSQLDVGNLDTLATQLALLVDGAPMRRSRSTKTPP